MGMKVGANMAVEVETVDISYVRLEIGWLKFLLNIKSKQYNFDLQHPYIQAISQRLDELIVLTMKENR